MKSPPQPKIFSPPVDHGITLLPIFAGIFVAVLLLSTFANAKIFAIGRLTLPGSTLLFPLVFVFNDILTEVYGYAASRRVIWTGLACEAFAGISFLIIDKLPPAPFWPYQEAYHHLLGVVPRFAFGGLVAYFCGEFANSFVLSKMKYRQQGARGSKLRWRFVVSTLVGEAVDSTVFMIAAFAGSMPWFGLFETTFTLYTVKVLYEIVILPVHTRIANWVKDIESIDHIDTPETTNYNPFASFALSERTST